MSDATTPSYVQSVPDSTGKYIRNVSITELDPGTGIILTKQVQVVALSDPDTGTSLQLVKQADLLETNKLLRALVYGMQLLLGANDIHDDILDEVEDPNG